MKISVIIIVVIFPIAYFFYKASLTYPNQTVEVETEKETKEINKIKEIKGEGALFPYQYLNKIDEMITIKQFRNMYDNPSLLGVEYFCVLANYIHESDKSYSDKLKELSIIYSFIYLAALHYYNEEVSEELEEVAKDFLVALSSLLFEYKGLAEAQNIANTVMNN